MKNGKLPTREQRAIIAKNGLEPATWLVVKSLPEKLIVVNRESLYSGKKADIRELQKTKF